WRPARALSPTAPVCDRHSLSPRVRKPRLDRQKGCDSPPAYRWLSHSTETETRMSQKGITPIPGVGATGQETADLRSDDLDAVRRLTDAFKDIKQQLSRIIVGQEEVIEELLISLFSKGHCILEGVPGLAKTLMISTLSRCLSLSFSRIQFT